MLFREKERIISYGVEITNNEEIKKIILNSLSKSKIEKVAFHSGGWVKYDNVEYFFKEDESKQYFYREKETTGTLDGDFRNATSIITKLTVDSPFSIGFGAESIDRNTFSQLTEFQQKYIQRIRDYQHINSLTNLLYNKESLDVLSSIISFFGGNVEMLNMFLETYHPDLSNFKKILPYFTLYGKETFSFDEQSELLYCAQRLGNQEETEKIKTIIDTAEENSNIAKKLSLEFKHR